MIDLAAAAARVERALPVGIISQHEDIDTVREQILAVRETGLTNMFDKNAVQCIAFAMDYYELVTFLEEHPDEYVNFILFGDA